MISLEDIQAAACTIDPFVVRTPLVYSSALSRMHHAQIYLKLENLQKTGSFKIRGAAHKIFRNFSQIPSAGVVAASAGNHAQGVALAGLEVNILNVFHERHQKDLPLYISRVHIELETRNAGHIDQVITALKDAGYHIEF